MWIKPQKPCSKPYVTALKRRMNNGTSVSTRAIYDSPRNRDTRGTRQAALANAPHYINGAEAPKRWMVMGTSGSSNLPLKAAGFAERRS